MSFRNNQHHHSTDDSKQEDHHHAAFRRKSETESALLQDVEASRSTATRIWKNAAGDTAEARLASITAQLKEVQAEARATAKEIEALEKANQSEIERLTKLSQDESAGRVRRGSAVQLLAQIHDSDPIPLRKAKFSQEAVLRKLAALLDEKHQLEAQVSPDGVQIDNAAVTKVAPGSKPAATPAGAATKAPTATEHKAPAPTTKSAPVKAAAAAAPAKASTQGQQASGRPPPKAIAGKPFHSPKTASGKKKSLSGSKRSKKLEKSKKSTKPAGKAQSIFLADPSRKRKKAKSTAFYAPRFSRREAAMLKVALQGRGITISRYGPSKKDLKFKACKKGTIKVQRRPHDPYGYSLRQQNPRTQCPPIQYEPAAGHHQDAMSPTTVMSQKPKSVASTSIHATTAVYDTKRRRRISRPADPGCMATDLSDFAQTTRQEHPNRIRKAWIWKQLSRDPVYAQMPAFKRAFARCLKNSRNRQALRRRSNVPQAKGVCYFPSYQTPIRQTMDSTDPKLDVSPSEAKISGPIERSYNLTQAGTSRTTGSDTNTKTHNKARTAGRYAKTRIRSNPISEEIEACMDEHQGAAQLEAAHEMLKRNEQWTGNLIKDGTHARKMDGASTYGTLKNVSGRKIFKNAAKVPTTKIMSMKVPKSVRHQRLNPMGPTPSVHGHIRDAEVTHPDDDTGFHFLPYGGRPRGRAPDQPKKRATWSSSRSKNNTPRWEYSLAPGGANMTAVPISATASQQAIVPSRQFQSVAPGPIHAQIEAAINKPMLHLLVDGPSTAERIPAKQQQVQPSSHDSSTDSTAQLGHFASTPYPISISKPRHHHRHHHHQDDEKCQD